MSLPVRCYTCNRITGKYETELDNMLKEGKKMPEILKRFNLSLICCRRIIMGYVNLHEQLNLFSEDNAMTHESKNSN
jgi:DNA-directed RNA polymerases I, II, and III subunit RPABC5